MAAVRHLAVAGLTAVLVGVAASPTSDSALQARRGLQACDAVPAAPRHQPAGQHRAAACRARPSQVFAARDLPRPRPGYHHLGATSAGGWSGVLGRLTVRDAGVRAGTHDFVATRFMAKREQAGRMAWLEVGWAETGWSGAGRQRIYTFDTNRNAWTFYEQYALRDGDQIWFYLHTATTGGRPVWQAWLWWGDTWHLLVAENLPLGERAQVEQYVEVYIDPDRGGPDIAVPGVKVDNVQVKDGPLGALRYWRADVATAAGTGGGRYCVTWHTRFDTWTAGDC